MMINFEEPLYEELEGEENNKIHLTVPPSAGKIRLDAFLSASIEKSRAKLKNFILEGHCLVNERICLVPDLKLHGGEQIEIFFPEENSTLLPEPGELEILYQDEDIAVINKPAGITTHPCPNCSTGTLVHRLLFIFPCLREQIGDRPGIVHRLDKETSGLMIIALSERARIELIKAFASREVHKTYLALTYGIPPSEGQCREPIGRHQTIKSRMDVIPENHGGKPAHTEWKLLYSSEENNIALLAVRLFSGRTHQIRVHLAHRGFPLIGDSVYGTARSASIESRQMLHAWKLEFRHPITGKELSFICQPPEDFLKAFHRSLHITTKIILTGMPGCGKSSVLQLMEKYGAQVWSADREVEAQYQPGSDGVYLIRRRFGEAILTERGGVDKTKLAKRLIEYPEMRRELESLIHPLVYQSLKDFFSNKDKKILVAEIPLWFETGWKKPKDTFITVITCPDEIRFCRIRKTRNWSEEKIQAIESWQWTQERKIALADMCIRNDGTPEDLAREINFFFVSIDTIKKEREERKKKELVQILNTTVF